MALNDKERKVLGEVIRYTDENGFPPSQREIAKSIGMSPNMTWRVMHKLQSRGFVTKGAKRQRRSHVATGLR